MHGSVIVRYRKRYHRFEIKSYLSVNTEASLEEAGCISDRSESFDIPGAKPAGVAFQRRCGVVFGSAGHRVMLVETSPTPPMRPTPPAP